MTLCELWSGVLLGVRAVLRSTGNLNVPPEIGYCLSIIQTGIKHWLLAVRVRSDLAPSRPIAEVVESHFHAQAMPFLGQLAVRID